MVLMKNAAKARAPRSVCCVASSGMTGGFSPGRVFGPVVGTLRGTVGWLGCGGPGLLIVIGGGVDFGIGSLEVDDRAGMLDAGVVTDSDVLGARPPDDDVHAVDSTATTAVAYAANARIRPTEALCPMQPGHATIQTSPVDRLPRPFATMAIENIEHQREDTA
jgi:hypothetical protein